MTTKISTADLYDEHGDSLQVCTPIFRNFGGLDSFTGPIKILKAFENFQMTRSTLEADGKGHVLVIDGGGSMRCAMLGDKLAQLAIDNHWAGVLINGCIRDSAEIGKLPVGVKALGTNPTRPSKEGGGQLDIAVRFGGVLFRPGDFLYADSDGIVLSETQLLTQA